MSDRNGGNVNPLALCSPGQKVVIRDLAGGHGLRMRMEAMGFLSGEEIEVIHVSGGPVIVNLKGARVGIGHGMAMKILVSPI